MEINDLIIRNISKLLTQNNLTWSKLATMCGVNRQNFYNYRDKKNKISLEVLVLIANRLNIDPGKLLNDTSNNISEPLAKYENNISDFDIKMKIAEKAINELKDIKDQLEKDNLI